VENLSIYLDYFRLYPEGVGISGTPFAGWQMSCSFHKKIALLMKCIKAHKNGKWDTNGTLLYSGKMFGLLLKLFKND